jgi:hypothetical protein
LYISWGITGSWVLINTQFELEKRDAHRHVRKISSKNASNIVGVVHLLLPINVLAILLSGLVHESGQRRCGVPWVESRTLLASLSSAAQIHLREMYPGLRWLRAGGHGESNRVLNDGK